VTKTTTKPSSNIFMNIVLSLKNIFWPIAFHENKKFLPMAAMMFFILFNYSTLRSIKDSFVLSMIGAEGLSFLKMYFVFPIAMILVAGYTKLCNILSRAKVFYTVTGFFVAYFMLFAFVIYPNPGLGHPSSETISAITLEYPMLKWFIRILGNWGVASFYVIAELWGSFMVSLLFWQFANQITKTEEAKRFYSMFGLIGNFGLLCTSALSGNIGNGYVTFFTVFYVMIFNGFAVMALYAWINSNVLTDPTLYTPADKGTSKKSKVKLSVWDSFKLIFSSKYLGMIAILVLSYGVSVNLIEAVWKSKVKELYVTKEGIASYLAQFQGWQGLGAIIFMLIGNNILRKVSWKTAAIITPLMMLVTGVIFFAFILFGDLVQPYTAMITVMQPLSLGVSIGMLQNVLSKATKYSLFDATKEMAYIPLDDELKTKGKAAVDVVGGRLGKAGGGFIQSLVFMIFPAINFVEATPIFAVVALIVIVCWLYGVMILSKEYEKQVHGHEL
jgi:AAA family ATP:ADP antiporter